MPKQICESYPDYAVQVAEEALLMIDGSPDLAYHNRQHTENVIEDFMVLADRFALTQDETRMGMAASAAHDVFQGSGDDESLSATWLRDKLRAHGVHQPLVELGMMAIKGTRPLFENGKMVGQQISNFEGFNSDRYMLPARLLACADLGRLYTPDGPLIAHQLLREINGNIPGDQIPFEDVLKFQMFQVDFLENFNYPDSDADKILTADKSRVLEYVVGLVDKIVSGEINNWDQLIEADVVFMG